MKKLFTLLTMLIVAISTSWAANETANFIYSGSSGYDPATGSGATKNNITIVFSGGSHSNSNGGYWNVSAQNTTITITSTKNNITSVAITHQAANRSKSMSVTTGTGTITGTAGTDATLTYSNTNAEQNIVLKYTESGARVTGIVVTYTGDAPATKYTVSFNAGDHGTYTGGDIQEESAGAGITLPALTTLADGYIFNGWFTAATGGEKAGNAAATYHPSANTTLYAQYTKLYTVTFNAGEHGTCATSSATEASAGAGVTLPTVTANDGYAFNGWFTASTGGDKAGDAGQTYKPSADTPLYAQYSEASAPTKPSITGVPEAAVAKNASVTLTASSTGAPNPTYQWYTCDSEGGNQSEITGAGEATYSPVTTSIGTTYYIVKASNSVQSGVASDVVAIQVVGSSECKLTEAKYSNGFNAFINESAKTVKAYYLAGTTVPTISSTQISAGATVDTSNPSSIVVTAEDGTTTATYEVEVSSVEPYSGVGCTFDGSESWIKTGGSYQTVNNNKTYYAWVINKNATTDDRIPMGKTRIYFFVDNASSITLINDRGTALSYNRDIKVYVNGEEQSSPTSMPAKNDNTPAPAITITTGSSAMVEIAANQTGGDTGWGKIVVNGASIDIPLNNGGSSFTKGFTTFCSPANFTVSEGATAYKAAIADGKLTMTALEGVIPANEGVVIAGTKDGDATIATTTATATADVTGNDLKGTTAAAKTADLKGSAAKFLAFKKSTSTFTPYGGEDFPANKAYLLLDANNDSQSLEMVFEEATGINVVNASETEAQAAPVKVIKNGQLYIGNFNVAGQQVK